MAYKRHAACNWEYIVVVHVLCMLSDLCWKLMRGMVQDGEKPTKCGADASKYAADAMPIVRADHWLDDVEASLGCHFELQSQEREKSQHARILCGLSDGQCVRMIK